MPSMESNKEAPAASGTPNNSGGPTIPTDTKTYWVIMTQKGLLSLRRPLYWSKDRLTDFKPVFGSVCPKRASLVIRDLLMQHPLCSILLGYPKSLDNYFLADLAYNPLFCFLNIFR